MLPWENDVQSLPDKLRRRRHNNEKPGILHTWLSAESFFFTINDYWWGVPCSRNTRNTQSSLGHKLTPILAPKGLFSALLPKSAAATAISIYHLATIVACKYTVYNNKWIVNCLIVYHTGVFCKFSRVSSIDWWQDNKYSIHNIVVFASCGYPM